MYLHVRKYKRNGIVIKTVPFNSTLDICTQSVYRLFVLLNEISLFNNIQVIFNTRIIY